MRRQRCKRAVLVASVALVGACVHAAVEEPPGAPQPVVATESELVCQCEAQESGLALIWQNLGCDACVMRPCSESSPTLARASHELSDFNRYPASTFSLTSGTERGNWFPVCFAEALPAQAHRGPPTMR